MLSYTNKAVFAVRIETLQYMLTVAETGSITKAAEIINMQKTSLSSAILAAEKELGFPVFIRSASGVMLTEKGEQALQIASEIVEQYKNLLDIGVKDRLPLSIYVNYSISELFFSEISSKLYMRLPNLQFRSYKMRPEIYLSSHKGKNSPREIAIDCYLKTDIAEAAQLAEKNGYTLETLSNFQLMAYINRKNPLSKRDYITVEMLQGQDYFFGVDAPAPAVERTRPFDKNYKVMDGGDFIQLLQIVNSSDVIGIFPEYKNLPFSPLFNDYTEVVPVPLTGNIESETSFVECLIVPKHASFSSDERMLLQLIRELIHD